jgi:hypothetical protein
MTACVHIAKLCRPKRDWREIIDTINMSTPAWVVCAWPTQLWQVDDASPVQLSHVGTHVLATASEDGPFCGQTLWAKKNGDRPAGLAWDWVEIREGVVAMADPLGVLTNVKFINDEGEAISDREVAIRLQQLVHALPWQSEVQRALRAQND